MASNYIELPPTGSSSSGVTSFNARIGAVVATIGDYLGNMITFTPHGTLAASNVQAAIEELDDETQTRFGTIQTEIDDLAFTERMKILSGSDRTETVVTWLDFGTEDERVSVIEYVSSDVPDRKLVKTLTYTLVSGAYVFTSADEEVVDA